MEPEYACKLARWRGGEQEDPGVRDGRECRGACESVEDGSHRGHLTCRRSYDRDPTERQCDRNKLGATHTGGHWSDDGCAGERTDAACRRKNPEVARTASEVDLNQTRNERPRRDDAACRDGGASDHEGRERIAAGPSE